MTDYAVQLGALRHYLQAAHDLCVELNQYPLAAQCSDALEEVDFLAAITKAEQHY
jgi:hypothetical protein